MSRREHVARMFRERFGGEPELWVRAPGRVDLMGSHTDYNLGFVLTMAISRDTWIAARRNETRRVRLYAANLEDDDCFVPGAMEKVDARPWRNYVRGVAAVLAEEGLKLDGFDGVVHSTVPLESGLSSSAALECAAAVVFRELGGWSLDTRRMALLCQRAENDFVGVNCGILDQFSSCLGEEGCALLLDCRDLATRPVPIAPGMQVMICNTCAPRRLAGHEYAARRKQCEEGAARLGVGALREVSEADLALQSEAWPDAVRRRSHFIVAENQRVVALASAFAAGDRRAVGQLMRASFSGARDLFDIVSAPMLAMMDAMNAAPGSIGARQAGAGFGGCMVAVVDTACTAEFGEAVCARYMQATGIAPEVYAVTARGGAGLAADDE